MAKYLESTFNLPIKDAYGLAWSGVPDATAFSNATDDFQFDMYNGEKITKSEVISTSAAYKDSGQYAKGHPICN